jgi:ABC-type lipoprotein export system ATPase subunit
MALLKGLRDQHQMTVLVVTNDLATAAAGDRTLRMRDGRVEEVDGSITPAVAPRSE